MSISTWKLIQYSNTQPGGILSAQTFQDHGSLSYIHSKHDYIKLYQFAGRSIYLPYLRVTKLSIKKKIAFSGDHSFFYPEMRKKYFDDVE